MNDNVKKHYNRKLDIILSRYITPKRYGDYYAVIKEVFQRRAYEYEFTESEIKAQVANFVDNVKTVALVPDSVIEDDAGAYVPKDEAIYLNKDYLIELERSGKSPEEIGEEILETFTHEIYHAIVDRDDDVGLSHYDYTTHTYTGNALDEIFTEVSADRASISRTSKEAEMYRAETTGYSDITFVVNMLSAGLGTTEKEILKAGIQDRDHLRRLFYSKFDSVSNAQFAEFEMFDKLESSLDVVYNCIYNSEEVDPSTNSQVLSTALASLYGSAYNLAIFQISNNRQEVDQEYVSSVAYRFYKMEKIMQDSLSNFRDKECISDEQVEYINYMTHVLRGTMAHKVLELQGIDDPQIDMLTAIKRVTAETHDMMYDSFIMREDFDNGKKWDNEAVSSVLYSIYDKAVPKEERVSQETLPLPEELQFINASATPVVTDDMRFVTTDVMPVITDDMKPEKKGFFSKIRESALTFFTRLKNSRIAKLSPPREEREDDKSQYYADLATSFSKKYAVKQDELRSMEDVLKDSDKRTSYTKDDERI